VVAPTSTMVPFSTCGRSASCCALFQRCTSSTKRIVRWSRSALRCRASSMAWRISFTPASTALMVMKLLSVVLAMTRARVVFPVPGGP